MQPTNPTPSSTECINCGYNLTGLVIGGVCPECGTSVEFTIRHRGSPTNGHAIASLIMGICSIILFCGPGIVCGLLGIILGCVAIKQIRAGGYDNKSYGMAIAGLICSACGLIIVGLFIWMYS